MFYPYVLKSVKTGRRYVGSCKNLLDRLHRHNTSQSKATKHGIPWILIHRVSEHVLKSFKRKSTVTQGVGVMRLTSSIERSPRRQVAGPNSVSSRGLIILPRWLNK